MAVRTVPAAAPVVPAPRASASTAAGTATEVMWRLEEDEGTEWPPYPAETIPAVLLAPGLAELTAAPWFATGISSGDVVAVEHDGTGWVGSRIIMRGGHTTVQMIAATDDELAPVADALRTIGVTVRQAGTPSMITVDIPESVPLAPVIAMLTAAESMTCAYTVACAQHRIAA